MRLSRVSMPGPVLIYRQPLDGHGAMVRRLWAVRRRILMMLGLSKPHGPTLYLVRHDQVTRIPPSPLRSQRRDARVTHARLKTIDGRRVD